MITRPAAVLIVNPVASRFRPAVLGRVTAALEARFAVEVIRTEARGHARILAQQAAGRGCAAVAVLAGDGTVSEAADGLAGSSTALAPLPSGVTNVFARLVGAPIDPVAAVARLAELPVSVDVGRVDDRAFLFSSGVGLSAAIMARAEADPKRKAAFGQLHFGAGAAAEIARTYVRDPPRLSLRTADGRSAEGITVVAQNADALTYFGPRAIRVARGAGLGSGSLSLTALRPGARARDVPSVLGRLLTGRVGAVTAHRLVLSLSGVRAATVVASGGEPLPVEADGEYLGERAEVRYAIVPGALRVLGYRPERMTDGSFVASAGRSRRERA